MQPAITLTTGSTTDPFLVNPDGWVMIEAGTSTATVQYSTGTPTDIAAGNATWVTVGAFTGFTALRADEELADTWVKITASGGSITYHVEGELNKADRLAVRGYKRTSINSLSPAYSLDSSGNVTGLVGPSGQTISLNGALDVRGFGAKCDGIAVYSATSTNSATSTITDATASFSASDIGKICVIQSYVDVGGSGTSFYGTITAVNSTTSVTASLNLAPGALTGATFIYGTDDKSAINAALAAVSSSAVRGAVQLPIGITITSGAVVVPTGCTLQGVANYPTGGKAKDIRHYGSSLVLSSFYAGSFVTLGSTSGADPRGTILRNLNVDGVNLCTTVVDYNTRTTRVEFCTVTRGNGFILSSSPTSDVHHCSFLGHNIAQNVVQLSGDSRFTNNIVTGAGNGFYSVKTSNGDDILIADNHMWKDSALNTLLGGQIFVSGNSGNVLAGGITIANNKFDTSYGPHIHIAVSGASKVRGINIIGNQGMQNDAVPAATYPWMDCNVATGCELRGLNVHGNIGRASFSNPANGTLTYFLDNSASGASTIIGSSITGNIMDNCAAGYNALTPTYTAGNLFIAGTGTTATAF